MMRLPAFTYLRPRELGEACAMLAEHGEDAALVAGGTDLFPKLKRRQIEPTVLVGLQGVEELRGIHANGGITIGAGARIGELVGHPALAGPYSALARAAGLIASPQIRNAGTVGGNLCLDVRCDFYDRPPGWRDALGFCLKAGGADVCRLASGGSRCWAISTSDLAPVALALEGSVRLVSAAGERRVPVADLYRDDGLAHLTMAPDEIVAELSLPPADGSGRPTSSSGAGGASTSRWSGWRQRFGSTRAAPARTRESRSGRLPRCRCAWRPPSSFSSVAHSTGRRSRKRPRRLRPWPSP